MWWEKDIWKKTCQFFKYFVFHGWTLSSRSVVLTLSHSLESLESSKEILMLDTPKNSDLIDLGCVLALGFYNSSLSYSNVQPSMKIIVLWELLKGFKQVGCLGVS